MKYKSIFITAILAILLFSCNNDDSQENNNISATVKQTKTIESLNLNQSEKLRVHFGRVFAKVIKESPELRKFIKDEALKRFNRDFYVMYHLVKDNSLNGEYYKKSNKTTVTYSTLRELLLSQFENESDLIEIENSLPLLTIFVPELPENSFSAETWDVNDPSQIPVVGVRLDNTNEVPMIDPINNQEYVLEDDLIPGYPVVVIKNNERVTLNTTSNKSNSKLNSKSDFNYSFLDDNFDSNITYLELAPSETFGVGSNSSLDPCPTIVPERHTTVQPFLKNAYDVFDGVVDQAWQRDNIYYQLTPSKTTNTYVGGKYVEAITYFQLIGDPSTIFSFMSNQNNGSNPDPQLTNQNLTIDDKRVPWTDGRFEIGISVTDNAKNRPNINATLAFDAKPSDLFSFTNEVVTRWRGVWPIKWRRTYFRPIIDSFKGLDFTSTELGATKLHIHAWDLTEYSNIWNIEIKEIDVTTEITTKVSNSKKYNTNIELSIPLGDKIKTGLKFGFTSEEVNTSERSQKWIEGSDFLGFLDVPFADKVIIKNPCDNLLYPRLYSNSRCAIEIKPIQV